MANRPKGDMAALVVPKAAAAAAAPFQPQARVVTQETTVGGPVALTVKLERSVYLRLKAYCLRTEQTSGQRKTHQAIAAFAIEELLDREGA